MRMVLDKYILYRHMNNKNKKMYIGITKKTTDERWKGGFGYVNNKNFFNDIVKFGWENFKHEIILDGLSKREAYQKEIEFIKKFDTTNPHKGYNLAPGGNLVSKETSKKISENKKDVPWSSSMYRSRNKIYQYDLNNNLIKIYKSLSEAIKFTNVKQSGISMCCTGKIKTYYGFKWSYKPL